MTIAETVAAIRASAERGDAVAAEQLARALANELIATRNMILRGINAKTAMRERGERYAVDEWAGEAYNFLGL